MTGSRGATAPKGARSGRSGRSAGASGRRTAPKGATNRPAPKGATSRPAPKGAAANRTARGAARTTTPRGAGSSRAPKGAIENRAPKGAAVGADRRGTPAKGSSAGGAKTETSEDSPGISRRAVKYGLAALVLIGAALMFMNPVRTVIDQGHQISSAHRQIQGLNAENAQLQQEIGALQTPADIEQIARQDYGLVQPGEQAYGVIPAAGGPNPPPPPPAPPAAKGNKGAPAPNTNPNPNPNANPNPAPPGPTSTKP